MNIIIPMAGMGKRMRPHTLTQPKPLIPIAGKPIVYRLVEDIARLCGEKIDEIAFVIGNFGAEVENNLKRIAADVGAVGTIHYQTEPLGTAHAIMCAKEALKGHVTVAFADTLFHADFKIDTTQDGIIWTKRIENPSAFGVVQVDENGTVKQFWEKPTEFVSDQAIIGIYYFKDGEYLHKELQYLLDNDIKVKGEFQLTDGLENMLQQGAKFKTVDVDHWLDCGNKEATVFTNKMVLELSTNKDLVSVDAKVSNSVIIPPCFIAQGAVITDSVVGPYVSVGANTKVANSVLRNSIVLENANISNANIENSMLGNYAVFAGKTDSINLGDYSEAC